MTGDKRAGRRKIARPWRVGPRVSRGSKLLLASVGMGGVFLKAPASVRPFVPRLQGGVASTFTVFLSALQHGHDFPVFHSVLQGGPANLQRLYP